jgi:hypothetical protein
MLQCGERMQRTNAEAHQTAQIVGALAAQAAPNSHCDLGFVFSTGAFYSLSIEI